MFDILALISCALLLGGMTFFSFGFAPVLFAQLPMEQVRPLLRGTFPYYYLAVLGLSVLTAALTWAVSPLAAGAVASIAVTTIYARQILMHQINANGPGRQIRLRALARGVCGAAIGANRRGGMGTCLGGADLIAVT